MKLETSNIKYIHFQKCISEWLKRFDNFLPTTGIIETLQKLTQEPKISTEDDKEAKRIGALISLFSYLGFVESIGVSILDVAILLLVANDYDFHVEREHETPRIIHAKTLSDLGNVSLGAKINFLERCNLKNTAKLIDKDLRNSVAHLKFKINDNGTVSARSKKRNKKQINIHEKIEFFYQKYFAVHDIFLQCKAFESSKSLAKLLDEIADEVSEEKMEGKTEKQ